MASTVFIRRRQWVNKLWHVYVSCLLALIMFMCKYFFVNMSKYLFDCNYFFNEGRLIIWPSAFQMLSFQFISQYLTIINDKIEVNTQDDDNAHLLNRSIWIFYNSRICKKKRSQTWDFSPSCLYLNRALLLATRKKCSNIDGVKCYAMYRVLP